MEDWKMTYGYNRCWLDGTQQRMQLADMLCVVIALSSPIAGHIVLMICS